jgi:CheY-like chemotaxis protein
MMPKILIAEDEPNLLALCASIFEDEGYDVHVARDGGEALDKLCKNGFDAALLDLMMPVKDGIAVCQELRSNPETQELPVIAMSASSVARANVRHCADMVIAKPFDINSLIDAVNQLTTPA